MLYALIFITSLCTINSLHGMQLFKNRKQTKTEPSQTIYKKIFLTRIIGKNYTLPQEIVSEIVQYAPLLRKKDFDKNFIHIHQWDDFRIPLLYQYLLTPEQTNIMTQLFEYDPGSCHYENRYRMHYSLDSKKDYKLFLTLPIEVRRCLTKLPQSAQMYLLSNSLANPDDNINRDKTIRVGTCLDGIKPKLIIPEEKIKHTKLDVNS